MGPTALLPLRRKACWGFFRTKNPTASAGCEPANLGTKGQHAIRRMVNSEELVPQNSWRYRRGVAWSDVVITGVLPYIHSVLQYFILRRSTGYPDRVYSLLSSIPPDELSYLAKRLQSFSSISLATHRSLSFVHRIHRYVASAAGQNSVTSSITRCVPQQQNLLLHLTLRLLMSYIYIYIYIYIYGAPILDVSRAHATTHHSR